MNKLKNLWNTNLNFSTQASISKMFLCVRWSNTDLSLPLPAVSAKTGALDASHLEEFKKQASCLNFTADFHFGETTGKMLSPTLTLSPYLSSNTGRKYMWLDLLHLFQTCVLMPQMQKRKNSRENGTVVTCTSYQSWYWTWSCKPVCLCVSPMSW